MFAESRVGEWVKRLCLVVVSVVITLLAMEGGVRLRFRRSMDFDMEMWKYATRVKEPSPDPSISHRHAANRDAVLMGVDVRTNDLGMRGGAVDPAKAPGTFRIVVIGDSFTMGWGVAEQDTWPRRLEKKLNASRAPELPAAERYEVLNLGVGNYNAVQELALLRDVGLRLEPDLIIMGSFINDAEPIRRHWRPALLRHSWLAAFAYTRLRRARFHDPRQLDYRSYYRGLYADGQPGWIAERKAWQDLGALSKQTGVPVVVYLLPELHDTGPAYPFLDVHEKLLDLGAEAGLPVIDLLPDFAKVQDAATLWVTPADAHPNARAHAIIAAGICATIGSVLGSD